MTSTKQAIPEWLSSEMKRNGKRCTQAWIAEKAEIEQTYVSDIKLGNRIPSLDLIRRLAAALTLIDDIGTRERVLAAGILARRKDTEGEDAPNIPEIERLPADERAIIAYYRNAPEKDKRVIRMITQADEVQPDQDEPPGDEV